MSKPYKTVDYQAANDDLNAMKSNGKVSPAQYRRLKKGIANIQSGQDKGFAYDVDSSKGTFTAKNEKGEDARGKSGGTKGLNFIEGRKTSKALSYLQKYTNKEDAVGTKTVSSKDTPVDSVVSSKVPETTTQSSAQTTAVPESEPNYSFNSTLNDLGKSKTPVAPVVSAVSPVVDIDTPKGNSAKTDSIAVTPAAPSKDFETEYEKLFRQNVRKRNYLGLSQELPKGMNRRDIKEDDWNYHKKMATAFHFEFNRSKNYRDPSTDIYPSHLKKQYDNATYYKEQRDYHQNKAEEISRIRMGLPKLSSPQDTNPKNINGGKVPMAEFGLKLQPQTPRTYNNSFLGQQPSKPSLYGAPSSVNNSFLNQPTPKFGAQGQAASYLKKPAHLSYQNFQPNQFEHTPAAIQKQGFGFENARTQVPTSGRVGHRSNVPQVPNDNSGGLNQDRSPRKIDKFGALNTAMGAWGLANVLTAKQPNIARTPNYNAVIRPYSGDAEQLAYTKNAINSERYAASNDLKNNVGSSSTAYLTGRSMLQSNSNQAMANAYAADGSVRRADRERFDNQMEGQNQVNFNNMVGDKNARDQRAINQYNTRVSTGQAMMQKSLGYANAKNADLENKEVAMKMIQERVRNVKDGARYNVLYGAVQRGGIESLSPELRVLWDELFGTSTATPSGQSGMKIKYFKKGGTLDVGPTKLMADANGQLKDTMLIYSKFVANASARQMDNFQKYVRQINKVNRINIKKN